MTPAADVAARVVTIPTLNRNMATIAAAESRSAQTFTLDNTGASKPNGPQRTGCTCPKMVWMANQIARLSTTPTTAAVMAEGPAQGAVAAQNLDEGCAQQDP